MKVIYEIKIPTAIKPPLPVFSTSSFLVVVVVAAHSSTASAKQQKDKDKVLSPVVQSILSEVLKTTMNSVISMAKVTVTVEP